MGIYMNGLMGQEPASGPASGKAHGLVKVFGKHDEKGGEAAEGKEDEAGVVDPPADFHQPLLRAPAAVAAHLGRPPLKRRAEFLGANFRSFLFAL